MATKSSQHGIRLLSGCGMTLTQLVLVAQLFATG